MFKVRYNIKARNELLTRAREDLGLNVAEAANKIGMTPSSLSSIELLHYFPGKILRKRILSFYKLEYMEEEIFPHVLKGKKAESINIVKEIDVDNFLTESVKTPEQLVGDKQIKKELDNILGCLSGDQRAVITMRFGLDGSGERKLTEVGDRIGKSRERTRQLEASAIRRLRSACLWRVKAITGESKAAHGHEFTKETRRLNSHRISRKKNFCRKQKCRVCSTRTNYIDRICSDECYKVAYEGIDGGAR